MERNKWHGPRTLDIEYGISGIPSIAVLASQMGYEPIGKVILVKQFADIGRLLQLVRANSMLSERAHHRHESSLGNKFRRHQAHWRNAEESASVRAQERYHRSKRLRSIELAEGEDPFSKRRCAKGRRRGQAKGVTMSLLCLNSEQQQPKQSNANSQIRWIFRGFVGSSWSGNYDIPGGTDTGQSPIPRRVGEASVL